MCCFKNNFYSHAKVKVIKNKFLNFLKIFEILRGDSPLTSCSLKCEYNRKVLFESKQRKSIQSFMRTFLFILIFTRNKMLLCLGNNKIKLRHQRCGFHAASISSSYRLPMLPNQV